MIGPRSQIDCEALPLQWIGIKPGKIKARDG